MSVLPPPAPGVKARPPSPPGRPPTRRWPFVAAVAGTALAAGLLGVLIGSAGDEPDADRIVTADQRPPVIVEGAAAGGPLPVRAVVDSVGPSVVTISADLVQGRSVGTGIVLAADGEILTNAHVVNGATEIRVRLPGETEPIPAEVVASDAGNDLALCRSTTTTSCR